MTNLSFITDILKKLVPQGQEQGSSALPVIGPTPTNPVNPAPVAQFPSPVTTPGFNPNAGPIPGIETLGGYQPTEPAQLPQITPPAPASSETGPTAALPVIGPDVTTRERVVAEPPPIVAAPTPESEYARRSDPAYFKTGEGRNKRWSLAEKIGAALAGWATGGLGGGIRAATDRNYFNRLNNDQEIARLLPVIGERRQQEKASSDQAYRTAATQNIYDDNKRQREADAERERHNREEETRKARAEKSRALYNEAILKEKKAGRELNEKQAQSLMQYREWLIDRGNKMDDVKIRQIDERLKDYDLDRQSRESIAGANRTSKEGIATENRKVKRENDPLGLFQ